MGRKRLDPEDRARSIGVTLGVSDMAWLRVEAAKEAGRLKAPSASRLIRRLIAEERKRQEGDRA